MSKTNKNRFSDKRERFHKTDRVERKMSEAKRRHIEDSLATDEYNDDNEVITPHSRY